MARKKPASEVEFAQVFGVGEAKLAKWGEAFLEALAQDE